MITLSRGIRDRSGSGEKEGVFFIDLNYSAISGLCDQSTVGTKGYAFILDAKGNIVYHPQQQQLYNELQTENISLIMDTDEDTVLTGTGNNGKLYSISRSDTIPAMDIRTKDANIGHEAKIGSISDEAVFYLMSRGMSEEDARACIVSGFADNVSKELPLEYAVEMNNLIRLEMKGSIG